MMASTRIRLATVEDAEAILEIYKTYIENTRVTFEVEVPTITAFRERMERITDRFPWIVCEIDGKIAGYAYGSKHGERAAYRWSADLSVYIHENYHRYGLGTALYTALLELLRKQGYFTVYAGVSTPNPKSEAFHTSFGFRNLGEFKNAGYKLGAWCGVSWYELVLNEYVSEPEETISIGQLDRRENFDEIFTKAEKLICLK